MNLPLRTQSLALLLVLSGAAAARQTPATERSPAVVDAAAPGAGNGSYLGLGMRRGTADMTGANGDDGNLGPTSMCGFFWVSGRGTSGPNPPGFHAIYQFDLVGNLVATYPQQSSGASPWGHRDLSADECSLTLWGGQENGFISAYTFNPAPPPAGVLTFQQEFVIPALGLVRALAFNPATGRHFTADFNGPIFEFELMTAQIVNTFPNPGRAFYGFSWEHVNETIWAFSQNNPGGGAVDLVQFDELDPLSGVLLGPSFLGDITFPDPNVAGGCHIFIDPNFPTFLSVVAIHQSAPNDLLAWYELARPAQPFCPSTASTFCTAKTGLVCGEPNIMGTGIPSASASSGYTVFASPARSCRAGFLVYNIARSSAVPFQGGTLCVSTMGPRRSGPTDSRGTPGGNCDGVFAVDMNAFAQSAWVPPGCGGGPSGLPSTNPAPYLSLPGTAIYGQFWGRDSMPTGSFVSNGWSWLVGP